MYLETSRNPFGFIGGIDAHCFNEEELRKFFGMNRQRLKILPNCAAKAVTSWMHRLNKSQQFTPGIVTAITYKFYISFRNISTC